jgi:tetratricopeptide (TPR) repeat protein
LHAHPEIEAGLSRLNALIAANPRDASLFLERGELYARHREWVQAEANYLAAAEIAPRHAGVFKARGALALEQGKPAEAKAFLDDALRLDPADTSSRILRARALGALREKSAALADYDLAFAAVRTPSPDLILERAALLEPAAAVRVLDEAIARIGPVPSLELRALALEEQAGRVDTALARLDRLTRAAERKETWLRRRGDLLLRAGRAAEARAAYSDALAAIASLPAWLRESPELENLAKELATLSAPRPSSSP